MLRKTTCMVLVGALGLVAVGCGATRMKLGPLSTGLSGQASPLGVQYDLAVGDDGKEPAVMFSVGVSWPAVLQALRENLGI